MKKEDRKRVKELRSKLRDYARQQKEIVRLYHFLLDIDIEEMSQVRTVTYSLVEPKIEINLEGFDIQPVREILRLAGLAWKDSLRGIFPLTLTRVWAEWRSDCYPISIVAFGKRADVPVALLSEDCEIKKVTQDDLVIVCNTD